MNWNLYKWWHVCAVEQFLSVFVSFYLPGLSTGCLTLVEYSDNELCFMHLRREILLSRKDGWFKLFEVHTEYWDMITKASKFWCLEIYTLSLSCPVYVKVIVYLKVDHARIETCFWIVDHLGDKRGKIKYVS